MNVRHWLQHLNNLRHRVRTCYLNALFRAKLSTRRLTVPKTSDRLLPDAGTDLLLAGEGRTFRLLSSDLVTPTPAYQDWIAPLQQLPTNATPAEVRSVLERMFQDQSTEGKVGVDQVQFSIQDYTQSLPTALRQATEFVQFGHATRQPGINLLSALMMEDAPQQPRIEPAILLVHSQSRSPRNLAKPGPTGS